MKKIITLTIVALLLLGMFTFNVSAQENVSVYINGEKIEFDVQPQIINGRTMVPMRKIFEEFGFDVEWVESQQMAKGIFGKFGDYIGFIVGKPYVYIIDWLSKPTDNDTKKIETDVSPQIINGRTLIPLRALAECIEANIVWNSNQQCVFITYSSIRIPCPNVDCKNGLHRCYSCSMYLMMNPSRYKWHKKNFWHDEYGMVKCVSCDGRGYRIIET